MNLRMWAAVAVATLTTGCGDVETTAPPPDPRNVPSRSGANVYVNACDLLDIAEVGTVIGSPIVERLLYVAADRAAGSCDFNTAWSATTQSIRSVEVNVSPKTEAPRPITSKNPVIQKALQPLEGVGAHAAYVPPLAGGGCDPGPWCPKPSGSAVGMVLAVTREGVSLLMSFETSVNDPTLRDKAVALARAAAANASRLFPGDRERLPAPSPPPIDLCALVTVAEQVKFLGWAPTSETSPAGGLGEYVGEPGGGFWECARGRGPVGGGLATANFTVQLTKEPVPETAWDKGDAVPALGRGARLVRSTARTRTGEAAILMSSLGGRRMRVSMWDNDWDAARHEAALLALARIARDRAGR